MFSSMMLRDLLEQPSYRHGFLPELYGGDYYLNPHVHLNIVRPHRQISLDSNQSGFKTDPNKFQVMLNVKHFSPSEMDVKVVDDFVVIHCHHEEHADEHGFVSREFTRRYKLPEDVESEKVTSTLSKDGILTIQAPRKTLEPPPVNERIIPITIQQPSMIEEAQKIEQAAKQAAAATSEEQNK